MKKTIIIIIALIIVAGAVMWALREPAAPSASDASSASSAPVRTASNSATYACDGGKTISVAFYEGAEAPQVEPGEMPVPTGTAEVSLDGSSSTTLRQTLSADGARYANDGESFVFWNKGDEALIMRDNAMDLSYKDCKVQ
jgi:membrane-bound inhibitor of C-type lysozyme